MRLLTAAFWQAGNLPAAARAVRDWARVETDRPTPERFAARIYEDMGAIDLAADAAARAAQRAPEDASAWERLGRLRLRLGDRGNAISALEQARLVGPTVEGLLDLALAYHLAGDVGAEVSAAEAATRLDPESGSAWSGYAHALARTDRLSECAAACRQALALGDDPEVADAAGADRGGHATAAVSAQRRLVARRPLGVEISAIGSTPWTPLERIGVGRLGVLAVEGLGHHCVDLLPDPLSLPVLIKRHRRPCSCRPEPARRDRPGRRRDTA